MSVFGAGVPRTTLPIAFHPTSPKPGDTSLIYLISNGRATKIGLAKDPKTRKEQLQNGNDRKLYVVYTTARFATHEARDMEYDMHQRFSEYRLEGEWFSLNPIQIVDVWHQETGKAMFTAFSKKTPESYYTWSVVEVSDLNDKINAMLEILQWLKG